MKVSSPLGSVSKQPESSCNPHLPPPPDHWPSLIIIASNNLRALWEVPPGQADARSPIVKVIVPSRSEGLPKWLEGCAFESPLIGGAALRRRFDPGAAFERMLRGPDSLRPQGERCLGHDLATVILQRRSFSPPIRDDAGHLGRTAARRSDSAAPRCGRSDARGLRRSLTRLWCARVPSSPPRS